MAKTSKTKDDILSFVFGFDKEGDASVFVRDNDTGEEVQLAADIEQIDEVISILEAIKLDVKSGPRTGYDLDDEEDETEEEDTEEEAEGDEEEETD